MLRDVAMGVAAGAVGTAALNIATYADMAIRGRPASSVPDKVAGALAKQVGVDLSADGDQAVDETARNRRTGIGALMGYFTGLGVGALYGALRPSMPDAPLSLAGVGVGLAAMAMSDVPATATGATEPATWSASDWAFDVGFHLVYGIATVIAFDAFGEA